MQKGQGLILVLVGILVIVAVAGGAYYLGRLTVSKPSPAPVVSQPPQPSSDETVYTEDTRSANWKIYTYSMLSLKLPPEWSETSRQKYFIQFANYNFDKDSGREFNPELDKGKLKIEISIRMTSMDLRDLISKDREESIEIHGDIGQREVIETPFLLGGQPAIKVPGIVYVQDPSKSAVITIAFLLDFYNYPDLESQILSTFKFLK